MYGVKKSSMPRRSAATIRPVEADSIHRSRLVQQVINKVMQPARSRSPSRSPTTPWRSSASAPAAPRLRCSRTRSRSSPRCSRSAPAASAAPPTRSRSRSPLAAPARSPSAGWSFARNRREKSMADRLANETSTRLAAGRRLEAQGRHLPHGAGEQGVRPLPLVVVADASNRAGGRRAARQGAEAALRRGPAEVCRARLASRGLRGSVVRSRRAGRRAPSWAG